MVINNIRKVSIVLIILKMISYVIIGSLDENIVSDGDTVNDLLKKNKKNRHVFNHFIVNI